MREVLAGFGLAVIGAILAAGVLLALRRPVDMVVSVAVPLGVGLWGVPVAGAVLAWGLRRRAEAFSSLMHISILAIALLVGLALFLLVAWGVTP
jgi:hypothetical protein